MKSAGAEAVLPFFDSGTAQRVARDCNAIGYHPQYVSGGLSFDTATVAQDPNFDGLVIATSVFPWMTSDTAATKAFQEGMATYAPDVPLAEAAAKSWTAGVTLEKALSNLGDEARTGPITSAMIIKGLATIKNDNLGGLEMGTLTYHAGAPATPNLCWGQAKLSGGKWIAPTGAKVYCQ